MRAITLATVTAMIIATGPSLRIQAAQTPVLLLEIRRAQWERADGLLKAELAGPKRRVIYLHPKIELSNTDVAEAMAGQTEGGHVAIDIVFTDAGAKKFAELTAAHLNHPVAFLIDGKLVCAPIIAGKLSRQAQLFGDFTKAEAERIAEGITGRSAP